MVRIERLGATSEGLCAYPDKSPHITLSRRGDVRLVSRERSPQASRIQPFDVIQVAPQTELALPLSSTVDFEERAFLTEVALSGFQ